MRFYEFLKLLEHYGYQAPQVDYQDWAQRLAHYVSEGRQQDDTQHALLPLYHFVTADLPANTRASELDDSNAMRCLEIDSKIWATENRSAGSAVTRSSSSG